MPDRVAETATLLTELMMEESDQVQKLVLPALRDTLREVRDVRMSLSTEVTNIIGTFGTLNQVAKYTDTLVAFAAAIERLESVLKNLDPFVRIQFQDLFRDPPR
jgi:hypothetical protein